MHRVDVAEHVAQVCQEPSPRTRARSSSWASPASFERCRRAARASPAQQRPRRPGVDLPGVLRTVDEFAGSGGSASASASERRGSPSRRAVRPTTGCRPGGSARGSGLRSSLGFFCELLQGLMMMARSLMVSGISAVVDTGARIANANVGQRVELARLRVPAKIRCCARAAVQIP